MTWKESKSKVPCQGNERPWRVWLESGVGKENGSLLVIGSFVDFFFVLANGCAVILGWLDIGQTRSLHFLKVTFQNDKRC